MSFAGPLKLVVVEDERPARAALIRMLVSLGDVEVVGEADDVASAVQVITAARPHGVFLDIRLPSGTGFDVLRQLDFRPEVVFATAHNDQAIAAFELAALDYLLKPFTAERLAIAVDRFRGTTDDASVHDSGQLQTADSLLGGGEVLQHIFVRRGRRIVLLPVDDILRIEADGMYTRFVTAREVHVATIPLSTLSARLPAQRFLRVHRGHIVNLAAVTGFTVLGSGRLQVDMRDGTAVPCSRERARDIRQATW